MSMNRGSGTMVTVDATVTSPAEPQAHGTQALYLYGIARSAGVRRAIAEADGVVRIRYRDLDALVRPAIYELPPLDDSSVHAHQRVVEAALRRGTVLPAPWGVVFRSRRSLLHWLQNQYTVLDEGLTFLEGNWELRVHITPAAGAALDSTLKDLAMQLYSELRRGVRAAVPFAVQEGRLLSAAFLVDRTTWLEFMQRAEDLGVQHREIVFDITGPWPPYDFVRLAD
jgi:hypothetical protein